MTPRQKAIETDQRVRRQGMKGLPKPLPKDPAKRADALDENIRDNFLGFVQLGQDLMQMRDERLYLYLDYLAPKYGSATWENYVKDVQDLSLSRTAEVIQASMVFRAIENGCSANGGTTPDNARQCRVIAEKVAKYKYIDRVDEGGNKLRGGKGGKVPVAVKNPDVVQAEWSKVVKEHKATETKHEKEIKAIEAEAKKLAKSKEDKDRKKAEDLTKQAATKRKRGPRKMSAKFIYEALPKEYKVGDQPSATKGTKESDIWGRASLRFIESMKRFQRSKTKMQQLANKEEWHDYGVETMMERAEQIKEACDLLITTLDGLEVYDAADAS